MTNNILCRLMIKVYHVSGHGRLMNPPARNAMWRFGFPNPVDYNDNELYCGGFTGKRQRKFVTLKFLILLFLISSMGTK